MKLVFERVATRRHAPIKVDWASSDTDCSWSSFFFEPTSQELRSKHVEFNRDNTVALLAGYTFSCIPDRNVIYAVIGFSYNSDPKGLETLGLKITKSLKGTSSKPEAHIVEVKKKHIQPLFHQYDDWQITPWVFLSSEVPVPEWIDNLESLKKSWQVRKNVLSKFDLLLVNTLEHGMDVMSCKLTPDVFLESARAVSREMRLPLEER